MKKFAALMCICIAAYVLYNLQTVKMTVNESLNSGTLRGVENCVSYSTSELVSTETTRNSCVARIQKSVPNAHLINGLAGPRVRNGQAFLDGDLNNDTSGHIATWFRAYIGVHDETGKRSEYSGETFIWVEPQSSQEFSIELDGAEPEQFQGLDFCPKSENESTYKSCIVWGVSRVRGIEI